MKKKKHSFVTKLIFIFKSQNIFKSFFKNSLFRERKEKENVPSDSQIAERLSKLKGITLAEMNGSNFNRILQNFHIYFGIIRFL